MGLEFKYQLLKMSLELLFSVNASQPARVVRQIDEDFIQICHDSEAANESGDSKCVQHPDLFV